MMKSVSSLAAFYPVGGSKLSQSRFQLRGSMRLPFGDLNTVRQSLLTKRVAIQSLLAVNEPLWRMRSVTYLLIETEACPLLKCLGAVLMNRLNSVRDRLPRSYYCQSV